MKGQQARADLGVMSGLGRQGFGAPLFSHCFVTWAAALTVAGSVSGVDLGLWGGGDPRCGEEAPQEWPAEPGEQRRAAASPRARCSGSSQVGSSSLRS